MNRVSFSATLLCYPGKGGWTFAALPEELAPPVTHGWGRTPVIARLNNREWATSIWRDKSGQSLLPVPKKIRGDKEAGDTVDIEFELRLP